MEGVMLIASQLPSEGIVVQEAKQAGFRDVLVQAHGRLVRLRLSSLDASRIANDLISPPSAARNSVSVQPIGLVYPADIESISRAQPPSFEDVRLMIREEIRAALAEQRTGVDGSHQMRFSGNCGVAPADTRTLHTHAGPIRGPSLWGE